MMFEIEDYSLARNAGDYLNAVGIWDAMAYRIYDHLELSGQKIKKCLPPIFSSFMPKSGGTFLYNRMIKLGYRNYFWGVSNEHELSEVHPTPNAVKAYKQGGVFSHTHATPSAFFCMIDSLVNLGVIWVHVRNPLDASLAAVYHYQGEGQGDGLIRNLRITEIEAQKLYLAKHKGIDFENRESVFMASLEHYVGWLSSWLKFATDNPGRVRFTFFEELSDASALINRVLTSYGYHGKLVVDTHNSEDRLRLAGERDWRLGLRDATIERAEKLNSVWEEFLEIKNLHP